jgi:putative oxidoreductase
VFSHPGFIHAILFALLVPILFAVRRAVPGALNAPPISDDAIAARVRRRRLVVLELVELTLAAVFLLVGGAKLLGNSDMVALFRDIGVGQWFRYVTGVLEVLGAALMVVPLTSGASAVILGGVMVAATLIELLVLHRPPVAAAACLSGHVFVAWARLSRVRPRVRSGSSSPRVVREEKRPVAIGS